MADENRAAVATIVFSLEEGIVRASWHGRVGSVVLGGYEMVTEGMRDFLAQCEIGERLASRNSARN